MKNHLRFHGKMALALDCGLVRTGTALMGIGREPIPYAGPVLASANWEFFWRDLQKLLEAEGVELCVLGLSTLADGKDTAITQRVRKIASCLRELKNITDIYFVDEYLTSHSAELLLKERAGKKRKKEWVDSLSAKIILEEFLEMPGPGPNQKG